MVKSRTGAGVRGLQGGDTRGFLAQARPWRPRAFARALPCPCHPRSNALASPWHVIAIPVSLAFPRDLFGHRDLAPSHAIHSRLPGRRPSCSASSRTAPSTAPAAAGLMLIRRRQGCSAASWRPSSSARAGDASVSCRHLPRCPCSTAGGVHQRRRARICHRNCEGALPGSSVVHRNLAALP